MDLFLLFSLIRRDVKNLLDETTEMPAKTFVIVFSNDKLTETTDLPWRAKNSRSNCFVRFLRAKF